EDVVLGACHLPRRRAQGRLHRAHRERERPLGQHRRVRIHVEIVMGPEDRRRGQVDVLVHRVRLVTRGRHEKECLGCGHEQRQGEGQAAVQAYFSRSLASSQSASISPRLASAGFLPPSRKRSSTWRKRRRNFPFAPLSALSGSCPSMRATLTAAKNRSPTSSPTRASVARPAASASLSSRTSSSSLASAPAASGHSNPTRETLVVIWNASITAGTPFDTLSSIDASARPASSFSAALMASQLLRTSPDVLALSSANTWGCRRTIFSETRATTSAIVNRFSSAAICEWKT